MFPKPPKSNLAGNRAIRASGERGVFVPESGAMGALHPPRLGAAPKLPKVPKLGVPKIGRRYYGEHV